MNPSINSHSVNESLVQFISEMCSSSLLEYSQVGLASRVDSYINGGKLFHAYKLVQDLRIEVASFRVRRFKIIRFGCKCTIVQGKVFLQQMNRWIDLSLNKIKEEAKKSVSSWLQHIRASSLVLYVSIHAGFRLIQAFFSGDWRCSYRSI